MSELTTIEITPQVASDLWDTTSPYYSRTPIDFKITSSTKFDKVIISHLGFRAYSRGKNAVRHKDNLYLSGAFLEPNCAAHIDIAPFGLTFQNIGDSFLRVNVRLRSGIERCKMTILQERDLPRAPKDIDEFIKFEQIWYCTAVINCLQTLRIEEIVQQKG